MVYQKYRIFYFDNDVENAILELKPAGRRSEGRFNGSNDCARREKIAGVENTYEKQALAQNAQQVELEEKGDHLRGQLSTRDFAAQTHKQKTG